MQVNQISRPGGHEGRKRGIMILQDVKKIAQMAVAQTMGHEYMEQNGYLTEIPAEKLADVGRDITDSSMSTEKFTKALSVIMARRESYVDRFNPMYLDIMIEREEWGGYIERDYIDFADIMDDPVMNLEDGKDYSAIEHKFYKPKVSSKIFEEGKSIMIPMSYQRAALTEAFNSYDSMNSFLSKIRQKTSDTLKFALDRFAGVLVECGIAISEKATKTSIHLLTEAKAAGIVANEVTSADAEKLLNNKDFLLFVLRRMSQVRSNMLVPSVAYNNQNLAVQSDRNIMYLNTWLSRAIQFGIYSAAFNKEDVTIVYKELPMWQASKATAASETLFDYATSTTVSFAADTTNKLGIGTDAVKIENVIGFLFDWRAIGICVFKEYATSNYTACGDFWNEFTHSLTNQIVDSTFPMVAFILD